DQSHLVLGRDHLGLVLEAVARPDLANADAVRQPVLDHELVRALHARDHRLRRHVADSVSILGATGALGCGLAVRIGRAGIPIVIGSRGAGRAADAAARAQAAVPGGSFEGLENADAARASDVVVLSVPFRNQSENLTNLKSVLREGQLLIDAR